MRYTEAKKVNRCWTLPWTFYDGKLAKLNLLVKIAIGLAFDLIQSQLQLNKNKKMRKKNEALLIASRTWGEKHGNRKWRKSILDRCWVFHIYGVDDDNNNNIPLARPAKRVHVKNNNSRSKTRIVSSVVKK